jgi:hypothetical protein
MSYEVVGLLSQRICPDFVSDIAPTLVEAGGDFKNSRAKLTEIFALKCGGISGSAALYAVVGVNRNS